MDHPVSTPARPIAAGRRPRDPITVLFAAALGDDSRAEDHLRELACHDDRAADALGALAYADGLEAQRLQPTPDAADIDAAEQTLAAVRVAVDPHMSRLRWEDITGPTSDTD